MTDVFLERTFDPPITIADAVGMGSLGADCLRIHRIEWRGSMLSNAGDRLVCWFRGADAESARMALRDAGAEVARLWPGTVYDASPGAPSFGDANVLVSRTFDAPVALESIQTIEDAGAQCLQRHDVRFARTFFSNDRRRMLCAYRAPDAESVRLAQRQAGMPVEAVWAFRHVSPGLPEPIPA